MPTFVIVRGAKAALGDQDRPLAAAGSVAAAPAARWKIARGEASTPAGSASVRRTAVHTVGVFVVSAMLALLAVAYVPLLLGRRPVLVSSGSMQPLLQTGDVVVIDPPRPDIEAGHVISFNVNDRSMIHRIAEVTDGGYVTKGDANATTDSAIVSRENVDGVGVMAVPYVGLPHLLYARGRWIELAGVFAMLLASFTVSTNRWLELHSRRKRE